MRAQVSTEAVFSVSVILFMAVVVVFFTSQQNSQTSDFFSNLQDKSDCQKLSGIIFAVYGSDSGSSVDFWLDSNALVSGSTVVVGEYYCGFSGSALSFSFDSPGAFRAFKNSEGVVSFEKSS